MLKVTVVPEATLARPVPPASVSVSLSRSTSIVPLSAAISTSSAVTVASTYALIDCCDANLVALLDAMLSSSKNALPEMAVFKTPLVIVGDVNVLFVSV